MNKMDKVILFLYAILAVYMLITSLLSKKRHFNNEKYLTIFKDSVAILIIPLLTNLLSDNKLATNQFIAYLVLIIALIIQSCKNKKSGEKTEFSADNIVNEPPF